MKRSLAVLAVSSAMVLVGCSTESEPVVVEAADVVAQKNAANLEKTVGTETETPATPASNNTPKATPETSVRGALIKQIGEPFGVLRDDETTKLIMFTMDSIQRVTAEECPNASNPYITIDDPGAGFAILNLTVTTFDNPPSFPQPLDLYSWYTVNTEGRVTTESGIRMDAMSCAPMDGQDMSNLLPNSTYSKQIVVAIPTGSEVVGYTWTDGVASIEWEWELPTA